MQNTGSFETAFLKKTSCVFADAFNKGLTSVLSGRLKTFFLAHSPGLYVHCTTVVQCLKVIPLKFKLFLKLGIINIHDMNIKKMQ